MESAQPTLNSLRVALLGDSGVGKRTIIQKLAKKQNQHLINPESLSLCENEVSFHLESTSGPCQITLVFLNIDLQQFETNQKYSEQISIKINSCTNALLMFSLLDRQSYKNVPLYFRALMRSNENVQSILISTKADDAQNIKIKQKMIMYHRKKNLEFYNVSSKAGHNLLEPFEYFFRKSLNNQQFNFIQPHNFIDMIPEVEFPNKEQIEIQAKENKSWSIPQDDDL